jgi:small ligand-binding sensory domain FIST
MMTPQIRFASATATDRDPAASVDTLADQLHERLGDTTTDLAVVFFSPNFVDHAKALSDALRESLGPRVLVGCSCEGVIGSENEIERQPAITLIAAQLPGIELAPLALRAAELSSGGGAASLLQRVPTPEGTKVFLLLADPFTTPMDHVLDAFNDVHSGVPIIGGMASGAPAPGANALFLDGEIVADGAVAVAMAGELQVDIIVSQGCRPVGPTYRVTRSHGNVIQTLDGEPALMQLQTLIQEISKEERELLQNGLFVGRAIDSEKDTLGRGDFLVRGLMGIDRDGGAIAVGDYVNDGEVVQFHLRDAATAKEDLEMMMTPQALFGPPSGAFLFSCNGRGTRLYDHPNGDLSTVQQFFPGINVAGFFCAGEIGPIGGRNFLHGHTVSLALFRPSGASAP